jgi:hypothetical protein
MKRSTLSAEARKLIVRQIAGALADEWRRSRDEHESPHPDESNVRKDPTNERPPRLIHGNGRDVHEGEFRERSHSIP